MSLHPAVVFLAGLVVIVVGAEMLLRGASRLAAILGIKPIFIGMTVVALGTSAPELAVGLTAVKEGKADLAVANIAGTNMLNILFVLGLSAAIRPLPLQLLSIKLDVPVMIASAVGLLLMSLDGVLSAFEGWVLVLSALVYGVALVRLSRRESLVVQQEFAEEYGREVLKAGEGPWHAVWHVILLGVGVATTVLGADVLVSGAIEIAQVYGVSDAVIGLTIVAIGTSAPELATTVVATFRDDRDVAVGNLIGSSITNILVILGLTCAATPEGVAIAGDVLWIDLPLAAAVAIACYPVFRSDQCVSRAEGIGFVTAYAAYLGALILLRT